MAHHSSIVGGSTAARRLACPGSLELERGVPDEASPYAQEGTALHDCMERLVDEDAQSADHLLGEMVGSIPALNHEQVGALNWCLEKVNDLIGADEFDLEVWGDFPGIADAGGTCDVAIFHKNGGLTLVDYKFGRGVPVDAKANAQGMFYALCMLNKYDITEFSEVTFHILQPRLNSHSYDVWIAEDLYDFQHRLTRAIEHARPEYVRGSHCKFCRGMSRCPAQREQAVAAYQWGQVAREDLPSALAIVEEVEEWAAAVRKDAHSALEAGASIQGWKLVEKRATRIWDPDLTEEQVERKLYRHGLLKEDRRRNTLISPAQAEKLLGKVAIQDMVVTKQATGTTLARESDSRPAVDRGPRNLQTLTDAMSSTTQDGEKT